MSRNKKLINIREPKRLFFSAIPVVRGGVQQETTIDKEYAVKFQFPWCVGEFNLEPEVIEYMTSISIPVVRGGVQLNILTTVSSEFTISIPVVRGGVQQEYKELIKQTEYISIPVVRGGVQHINPCRFPT